jgi:hypothetical protein
MGSQTLRARQTARSFLPSALHMYCSNQMASLARWPRTPRSWSASRVKSPAPPLTPASACRGLPPQLPPARRARSLDDRTGHGAACVLSGRGEWQQARLRRQPTPAAYAPRRCRRRAVTAAAPSSACSVRRPACRWCWCWTGAWDGPGLMPPSFAPASSQQPARSPAQPASYAAAGGGRGWQPPPPPSAQPHTWPSSSL